MAKYINSQCVLHRILTSLKEGSFGILCQLSVFDLGVLGVSRTGLALRLMISFLSRQFHCCVVVVLQRGILGQGNIMG